VPRPGSWNRASTSSALCRRCERLRSITIGLGIGLPYVPARPFAAIIGVTALLVTLALELPTRRALRARPVEAIGARE
jgi:hypothetical protein